MASGAVVLCEDSALYDHVLPRDIRVSYRPDLSDFREKLSGILFDQMNRRPSTRHFPAALGDAFRTLLATVAFCAARFNFVSATIISILR